MWGVLSGHLFRSIHTKDDNYNNKYIDKIVEVVLIQVNSRVYTTKITKKTMENITIAIVGITFRAISPQRYNVINQSNTRSIEAF